jgi:hypothetical protein
MGGIGSGCWKRPYRKFTVEECAILSISEFHGQFRPGSHGEHIVFWPKGRTLSILFCVTSAPNGLMLTLSYRLSELRNARIPIFLQATPTQFGGQRWWFTCPLIAFGVPCDRRVANLYLPPEGQYFGCRGCHELTYQSRRVGREDDFWSLETSDRVQQNPTSQKLRPHFNRRRQRRFDG